MFRGGHLSRSTQESSQPHLFTMGVKGTLVSAFGNITLEWYARLGDCVTDITDLTVVTRVARVKEMRYQEIRPFEM